MCHNYFSFNQQLSHIWLIFYLPLLQVNQEKNRITCILVNVISQYPLNEYKTYPTHVYFVWSDIPKRSYSIKICFVSMLSSVQLELSKSKEWTLLERGRRINVRILQHTAIQNSIVWLPIDESQSIFPKINCRTRDFEMPTLFSGDKIYHHTYSHVLARLFICSFNFSFSFILFIHLFSYLCVIVCISTFCWNRFDNCIEYVIFWTYT